jgi:papain like cysteine protease AvrRpt2
MPGLPAIVTTTLEALAPNAHTPPIILQEFEGEYQGHMLNWCWVAACASINNYFVVIDPQHSVPRQQCEIATDQLKPRDCCNHPNNCDLQGYLDKALMFVAHFDPPVHGPVHGGFSRLRDELDHRRPVGMRVQLPGGGEHFVVVYGYGHNSHLVVWDPARGDRQVTMFTFGSNIGLPQNTYFTV